MSKKVQIGNNIYTVPTPGTPPNWSFLTAWILGITDAVNSLFGTNDLLKTTANLSNNQTVNADISGLKFNVAEVLQFSVVYYIKRVYDSGSAVLVESGIIQGNYDGTNCYINTERDGQSGISIDVTSSGQFVYTASDLTDHISSVIYFKANTIDL